MPIKLQDFYKSPDLNEKQGRWTSHEQEKITTPECDRGVHGMPKILHTNQTSNSCRQKLNVFVDATLEQKTGVSLLSMLPRKLLSESIQCRKSGEARWSSNCSRHNKALKTLIDSLGGTGSASVFGYIPQSSLSKPRIIGEPRFVMPNLWPPPPSSPDLNPLDYCVWGSLHNPQCKQ